MIAVESAVGRPVRPAAATGTTGFLVARDQALLVARHPNGSGWAAVQTSFSVAKTCISAAVGAAIARGDLSGVDDPVVRWVLELADRGLSTPPRPDRAGRQREP